jgi:hypothetical protein
MKTTRCLPAGAALLIAASAVAQAAPMTIPAMKDSVARLLMGSFPARSCHGIGSDVEQPPEGVLTISADGRVVGPSIDVSLFDPAGELGFERRLDGDQRTLTVHANVYAGGQSFSIERAVPADSPGFMEAGQGAPNANVTRGTECAEVDFSTARIAAPSFNLATYVAPMFATSGPVRGTCRSLAHGGARATRPAQFVLDAHGVVVDGASLPFDSTAQPVVNVAVGSRLSDGTVNGSFEWADGSSFHAERLFGSDAFSVFSFTIHGRPDADKMFCQPGR